MTRESHVWLALLHHWWAWNHPTIHRALCEALVQVCVVPIEEALLRNAKNGLCPANLRELAAPRFLRRDPSHLTRLFGKKATQLRIEYLIGFATVLNASISDLIPDTALVIAEAALCLNERPSFSEDDALRYAQYRLFSGNCLGDFPNKKALNRIVAIAGSSAPSENAVLQKVLQVAEAIGPTLGRIDRELNR